jgi:LuxR family maltose regulon positive regulatory protein
MPSQDKILLQTKLQRPQIPRGLIDRPRLFAQLNDAMGYPLTLISAPAGYGKTTLVSTWLNQTVLAQSEQASPILTAWLSIDEEDSDLNLFVRYFIAALRTVYQNVCAETLNLLQALQQPPVAELSITFCNELEKLSSETILVIDDYQFIRGKEVHDLLGELIRHWPKSLHLVLISRIDPPLPLSSLRAKRKMLEIRTQDLRFSPEETKSYLDQAQFFHLNKNTLDLVDERFEGWPAGLHLAALSLRSAGSQEAVHQALSSEDASITEYLVDEVLTHQFPAIHSFLLTTSILDRFCASLCEAVIGEIDTTWNARACLDWIEHSDLFLIPLDNRQEWYRYHHIFKELLQKRLFIEITREEVNHLHRLASIWFQEHGLIDEAIRHSIAAKDYDMVAHLMSSGLREVLNREDRPTLERWLLMIPEEIIQQQPQLLIIRVWTLQFLWRFDLQAQVIKRIENLLESESGAVMSEEDLQILQAQLVLFRAENAYLKNLPKQAIGYCREALELLPGSWTFGRGAAMLFLGFAMHATGQAIAAERLLLDSYEIYNDKTDAYALLVLESLCSVYLHTGQLEQARQIAKLLVQSASRSGNAFMRNLGCWRISLVSYQVNDLQIAAHYFTQIIENRHLVQISTYRDAVAGMAIIYQLRGQSSEAWQMLESISQYDLEQMGSEDIRTRSLRARLLLMQGDVEGPGQWVDTFTELPTNQPLIFLEEPQVTRARVLIARGTETDLQLSMKILDTLGEITERTFNKYHQIIILALQALLLDVQGEFEQASVVLEQAVDLAKPGGFIRAFVDLGKPMANLLQQLGQRGSDAGTINRILDAFQAEERYCSTDKRKSIAAGYPSPTAQLLVEPLTRRELEVLALLRGASSIKEIAQKLNISYGTAKEHTINIYAKLGVNKRWAAVERAEELNILHSL